VATNPAEAAPGVATEGTPTTPQPGEEQQGQQPAGEEEAGEEEPGPYDELAQSMGWVPKAQFTGPPEQWKPAEQFIRDGRDIQRETARELRTLRATVDNIARTSGSIVETEVNRRVAELRDQHAKAVDEGDTDAALRIAGEIGTLSASVRAQAGPSPAAQTFADENKAWFRVDPVATARAIEVTNSLARQGYDEATQLKYARETVEREYPHLFGKGQNGTVPGKAPPQVHSPSSRSAGPAAAKTKGYVDMPKAARDVADDMVARGVLPDKEAYAKQYWQNEQRTA